MIRIDQVTKTYGRTKALDGLQFEVPRGSIFGFVGPNGAGKTTTIRILATLLAPSGGEAYVGGAPVSRDPAKVRQLIGYMPDFFGVYDDLRVDEYLDFYGASRGLAPARRKKVAADLLELIELTDKRGEYVDTLSRGMKQRLCLAQALVHDPSVLLLDEPASGLDPRARVEMRELIKELQVMGKTVLISSHILSELAEMCSHLAIIDHGRIVVSGPVDEVMGRTHGGRVLMIKVLDDQERAAEIIRQAPLVKSAVATADEIKVVFDGSDEALAGLLTDLIRSGLRVVSFTEGNHRLEDVFMQVTRGDGR
ncbi:MAG TPA: ABC transporter ATP-binding protein [Bacillota bacterium]|jgi:ABC-2 type transport system ATP-binding protein